jgi:hypothetical protein
MKIPSLWAAKKRDGTPEIAGNHPIVHTFGSISATRRCAVNCADRYLVAYVTRGGGPAVVLLNNTARRIP